MNKLNNNEVEINGEIYVKKSDIKQNNLADTIDGLPLMMVRTYSAGVFFGYLKRQEGKEVELLKARRVWYWSGAASLSQLATEGTSNPSSCKFPCEVTSVILTEAIELIPITDKAAKILNNIPIWKQ